MRLWSISPKYLDSMGLVALWREGLLAQKVLLGLTKGYRNHPQLNRFRATPDPILAIGSYLAEVEKEACLRGYRFDLSKIANAGKCPKIPVQGGQVEYEWKHLMEKLKGRAADVCERNRKVMNPEVHPLFKVVPGGIEDWERA